MLCIRSAFFGYTYCIIGYNLQNAIEVLLIFAYLSGIMVYSHDKMCLGT